MDVTDQTASEQARYAEQRLRGFVAKRLSATHRPTWEQTLSARIQEDLAKIRDQERADRPHAPVEPDLLGYAGFGHLIAVSEAHWNCCIKATALWPTLDVMKRDLQRLRSIRGPVQHGRAVLPHEFVEGEGAARRLRAEIERLWREEARLGDKFWVYIEEAEDSLGNRGGPGVDLQINTHPPVIVHNGDLIHLRVRAFDPLGRKLKYHMQTTKGIMSPPKEDDAGWQESPEFEWTADPVGRIVGACITVLADGGPHAEPSRDAFAWFHYDVRPRL
jgi:hypothetical protein